jgi:ATP-dependent helicase/nuclease subunit A
MNIVYNASAGTGKTYQVTQLYEKLVLEDGIDPRKILLMTFTDNAAAELRMRVSHRLLGARRAAEAAGDDELTERAIAAMAHLPSASIGTIHSFCTRLLREHALAAGLSPGFSVLAGDDREELLERICRDELLAQLETDPDFKAFCTGAHIIGSGKGFGTSITETVPRLIEEAGSLGIALENAETLLSDPVPPASLVDFEQICKRIRALPRITPAVQSALNIIEQGLNETNSAVALVEKLRELGIKKFGRGAKEISDDFWALKESVEDAVKYRERFPAAKAFARYVRSVCSRFKESKHEMDAVDFADQLRMAGELLESGEAAPEFAYVIVDEVQDTSRIQCELIQSLWGDATNLVICGDRKQSIYTWRGADPRVMPDLESELNASGNTETIPLQTSYRSKAPLLDVVNRLFKAVYGEEEYPETENLRPNPDFKTDGERPCVEFLSPDEELAEGSKQEKIAAEMEAVANRIRLLAGGEERWRPAYRFHDGFAPVSGCNNYRYSDILILLRRTAHQSALEHALRQAGIPYTLGGKGRGLFTRQETRDVSLFLNVITNPADVYSLVGFLRSPWIGLSDEAIAELAWSDAGFSVDNLLGHFTTDRAGKKACPASETISKYRELLGARLASELVRMLIDETGFDALLAGLPRGEQRLANLRKVLDWLRETERGAHTTPAAVARKLAKQIASPPQVPEAALLDPAQNTVTLMTVHGAKGLTKRVVMIPDISFRPDSDKGFARVFFDEQKVPTLGLKITAPDKSGVESPGFKAAKQRAKAVRDHELNNLFYVAMTRARDLVVASASVRQNPNGWLKQLEPLVEDGSIPAIPYSTLRAAVERPQIPTFNPQTPDHLAQAARALAPPPEPPKLKRISATRLAKETEDTKDAVWTAAATDNATALGSLGHAVLEQLAINGWTGSAKGWLERLCDEFGIGTAEAATLKNRIEATRDLMSELTADTQELRPELPFVLHDGDRLIDGTIDLLCRTGDLVAIFDYKFTEADDAAVTAAYHGQMAIYCKAARKAFPIAGAPEASLVIISATGPRVVAVHGS